MKKVFTLPSKRRVDVVSVTARFDQLLQAGEAIESGEVSVFVFSGEDTSPETLLEGAVEIEGSTLRQRIKLGIPGVIYQLVFSAVTDAENTYEVECRQAVLIDDMPVGPIYTQFYFTSRPYPIDVLDTMRGQSSYQSAEYLSITIDDMSGQASILGGALQTPLVTTEVLEELEVISSIQEGELRTLLISYALVENLQPIAEIREGVLATVLITYSNYPPENILPAASIQSGTLV